MARSTLNGKGSRSTTSELGARTTYIYYDEHSRISNILLHGFLGSGRWLNCREDGCARALRTLRVHTHRHNLIL
jgi:hypothetical protein